MTWTAPKNFWTPRSSIWVMRGPRDVGTSTGAGLVFGAILPNQVIMKVDQADQDDRQPVAVQEQVPWLAERDDAEHHQRSRRCGSR